MKLAVISDVHANFVALASAYNYIENIDIDGVIFLGDYVTDGPSPLKTMALLKKFRSKYKCWFIKGNREDYLLEQRRGIGVRWKKGSGSGSLYYTYLNLSDEDFDFFAEMPVSLDIEIDGAPVITACHGAPDSSNSWIMNEPELLEKYAASVAGDIILCGHTHRFDIQSAGGKDFIFCPTIGSKKRVSGSPNMLLLELKDGAWELDPVFVDFDITELNSDFESSGLIDYGKIYTKAVIASYERSDDTALMLVTEAWRLARADGYSGDINLPEEYWEQAAKNIGLDI